MRRTIIAIDEEKCDGCGQCVPSCKEGALKVIDGKARLVSEVFCDGLGACLGECPQGAIRVEEREAESFDAAAVERHLRQEGVRPPVQLRIAAAPRAHGHDGHAGGCPGSAHRALRPAAAPVSPRAGESAASALSHWPVQLTLVSPNAPFLKGADLLVCADCVPFAVPDFHARYLSGRAVLVGCPKLDDLGAYREKLAHIVERAAPKSVTALRMEVPCCSGIAHAAVDARGSRPIPAEVHVIGIEGGVLGVERFE